MRLGLCVPLFVLNHFVLNFFKVCYPYVIVVIFVYLLYLLFIDLFCHTEEVKRETCANFKCA